MSDAPFRVLPAITDRNRPYWTAGRDGVLRFQRCQDCEYWIHPPSVLCPICHSKRLEYEDTTGRATVHTFSINHQPWMPVNGALYTPWSLVSLLVANHSA